MARKPSESSPKSTGSKTVGGDHAAEQPAAVAGHVQIARGVQEAGEPQVAGEPAGPSEAAGPVLVTRLRKADGRVLILYSAAGDRA